MPVGRCGFGEWGESVVAVWLQEKFVAGIVGRGGGLWPGCMV